MKIHPWTLMLAVTGMTFFGGSLVWAETAEPAGERPARKHVLAGPKAQAQEKDQHPGLRAERPGPMAERRGEIMEALRGMMRDLDLTEDQKAQVKSILETARENRQKYMEAHRDEFKTLREKMKAAREARDSQQLQQLAQELRSLMESGPKPQDTINKIKDVLNPQQRAQLEERIQQWKQDHPAPQRPAVKPEGKKGDGDGKPPKAKSQD